MIIIVIIWSPQAVTVKSDCPYLKISMGNHREKYFAPNASLLQFTEITTICTKFITQQEMVKID